MIEKQVPCLEICVVYEKNSRRLDGLVYPYTSASHKISLPYSNMASKNVESIFSMFKLLRCDVDSRVYCDVYGIEWLEPIIQALKSGICPSGLVIRFELHYSVGNEYIKSLADALKFGNCPPNLKICFRSSKKLDTEDIETIADAIQSGKCPPRLEISLSQTYLGDAGAKIIATALQSGHCPPELAIDFSLNAYDTKTFTKEDSDAQEFVSNFPSFSSEFQKIIADALRSGKCPVGLRLNLSYNTIDDQGAILIADALQSGKCPEGLILELEMNKIRDEGAEVIKKAMKANINCYIFDIPGCEILNKRNELIKKYPHYKGYILQVCHRRDLYTVVFDTAIPSLKELVALTILNNESILKKIQEEQQMPEELIEFVNQVAQVDADLELLKFS